MEFELIEIYKSSILNGEWRRKPASCSKALGREIRKVRNIYDDINYKSPFYDIIVNHLITRTNIKEKEYELNRKYLYNLITLAGNIIDEIDNFKRVITMDDVLNVLKSIYKGIDNNLMGSKLTLYNTKLVWEVTKGILDYLVKKEGLPLDIRDKLLYYITTNSGYVDILFRDAINSKDSLIKIKDRIKYYVFEGMHIELNTNLDTDMNVNIYGDVKRLTESIYSLLDLVDSLIKEEVKPYMIREYIVDINITPYSRNVSLSDICIIKTLHSYINEYITIFKSDELCSLYKSKDSIANIKKGMEQLLFTLLISRRDYGKRIDLKTIINILMCVDNKLLVTHKTKHIVLRSLIYYYRLVKGNTDIIDDRMINNLITDYDGDSDTGLIEYNNFYGRFLYNNCIKESKGELRVC